MKSSTLSLVQWDFTSFLLGGFTAATIHSKRLRLFQLTRSAFFGWWWPNDNWVNCHMVCPKFGMPPTCGNSMFFFFLWWLNWWFFMADFDIQPSREKCFPHPILFHVVLPAMAPYPLWSPWLKGCSRAVIFLARKKTCISVYHYITSDICICI